MVHGNFHILSEPAEHSDEPVDGEARLALRTREKSAAAKPRVTRRRRCSLPAALI
jgi:hypothetical protein